MTFVDNRGDADAAAAACGDDSWWCSEKLLLSHSYADMAAEIATSIQSLFFFFYSAILVCWAFSEDE